MQSPPAPIPSQPERPPRQLLLAVAVISAASLGFEVSLTRLFSVLLRYHFAFLVISIALCGLGVGGYLAQWRRREKALSLPNWALWFAMTTVIALIAMLHILFRFFPQAYWLAALLVLVSFSCVGVFLAEAFARYADSSGKLYAWDLAGGAIAAIGTVGILQLFGAINACLVVAALGALAGVLAASPQEKRGASLISWAPILLLLLPLSNLHRTWLDIPPVPPNPDANGATVEDRGITQPLFTDLGTPGHTDHIVETLWNAFARTDVVVDKTQAGTYYVYTNGNVPTNMMQWDGSNYSLPEITPTFPLVDWVFDNAPIGNASYRRPDLVTAKNPAGDVLSIGPGGGLDALMALRYGAANFDGAEINPSIVGLMHAYRKFNGGIYEKPNVHVHTADGREAVREALHAGHHYALLYSALTKTATTGQGTALLESFIYTQDAFSDYWDVLTPKGEFTVVTDQPMLVARMFTTALAALKARGINEKEAMNHIAMAYCPIPGPYRYSFTVSKPALDTQRTFTMSDTTTPRYVQMVWLPGRSSLTNYGPYPSVASGDLTLPAFIKWWAQPANVSSVFGPMDDAQGIDVSPCPDDRPFVLDLTLQLQPMFLQLFALTAVLGLALAILTWRTRKQVTGGENHSFFYRCVYILYFAALGVGFMLVEIPLTQKLILPLGYPTLALTVILFSILLGGGGGAWFSQRFESGALRRWTVTCALIVALLSLGVAHYSEAMSQALLGLAIADRCLIVGLALLPFGFFLGTPFPSGIRLFSRQNSGNVPLLWGLNGVASVVGSLGAAMGAKLWGFETVLLCGVGVYVLAAGLIWTATQPDAKLAAAVDTLLGNDARRD